MTIEEKRRELFCAWFESLNHRMPVIQYYRGGHYYSDTHTESAWQGFNAALDAVVLPARADDDGGDSYAQGINYVLDAIESTGLGLKVLP